MDILVTVRGHFSDIRRISYLSDSVLSLNTAAKLMKDVANKSLSTMSLIEIKLSKAYLHRALRYRPKHAESDSINCLANVYLAVLCYATGQYQTAVDYCTLVTRLRDHSLCSSHVVQGRILPKVDDDVDNMLGLAELYQSIRTAALIQQRQPQLVSVLTTELFAYYLRMKYMSVTECCQFRPTQTSSTDELKRYGMCISYTKQLLIGDVLLFLSANRLFCSHPEKPRAKPQRTLTNADKYNTPRQELVELLLKSAVEHLTTYRHLVARELGFEVATVIRDFEALYAYKSGDYQQCLQLSTQNVHTMLDAVYTPSVPLLPEFIQLVDDDIVSLTALTIVVSPKCRDNASASDYCILQLTLSLYLMTQCQLKLRQSLTSLAQTLDYIRAAKRRLTADRTLDQLTLKLLERKVLTYLRTLFSNVYPLTA